VTDRFQDLREAIGRCLTLDAVGARAPQAAIERLRRRVATRRRQEADDLDPGVDALLRLAGIDEHALELAERRLADGLNEVGQLGVTIGDLGVVGQAYTRGVGPIAKAEAEIIGAIVRATPEATRVERLEGLIRDALPLARRTFELLHRVLLRDALLDELTSMALDETATAPAAIAHVDVIGSTALLQNASRADTERLVDGLFAAAQTAVGDRPVLAVKYVGDGVFLAGRDPQVVADAALECIQILYDDSGVVARAGLAYGPVVRRAGDFFGLTVNLSHALTKVAPPGGLLASDPAAAKLRSSMVTCRMDLEVTGLDGPVGAYEVAPPRVPPRREKDPPEGQCDAHGASALSRNAANRTPRDLT
jgi:class 3 adenylate cyclase